MLFARHRLIRLTVLTMACVSLASARLLAQPATPPAAGPAAGNGVPVTVVKPTRRDVPVYLRGLGSVAAFKSVLIRTRVDGTLDRVGFTEGDTVKQGDLLAQIDPRPYQATLDQALAKKASDEATLANARRDLNRYSQLARNQFAAQQQVDSQGSTVAQLEAALKGDDASIASAKLNLDYSRITAPFDGRVGLRQVDPGNFVRAADSSGSYIVALSQVQPISMTFTVPQDQLPAVATAMSRGKPKVLAYSADDATQLGVGELLTVDNAIDPTTGTIKVKATFPNADSKLWPGQFVNVRLLVDERKNVITLPDAAIQRGPQGLFVYVMKPDQTVAARPIDVLQDTGTISVIGKGLEDGDTVVLSGQSRLANGTRIAPMQSAGS